MTRFTAHLIDTDGEALCGEHLQAWQIPMPTNPADREAVRQVYRDHEKAKRILASEILSPRTRAFAQHLLDSTEPDPDPRKGDHVDHVHQCQGCMRLAKR